MGRRSRQKSQDTHDFKKGRMRANAYHWKVADKKCTLCGRPAVLTCRVFAPLDSIPPQHLMVMGLERGGKIPVVRTKYGKFIRIGEAAACAAHKVDLERQSAKHPDTWFVEFDRGPDHLNRTSVGGVSK